jgi:hypothetical protein
MKRRVMVAILLAATGALGQPAQAAPRPAQEMSIDGAFGHLTIGFAELRDLDLRVRASSDPEATIRALPGRLRMAMAYNFLPDTVTSVTLGPCTGGDPDQCDHVAPPKEPEAEVKNPPPPEPTETCATNNLQFSQTDLTGMVLYTFIQSVYVCWDGTNITSMSPGSFYTDEQWFWTCEFTQNPEWPLNVQMPPVTPAPSVQVNSIGYCHSDIHFDADGHQVDGTFQRKHPTIMTAFYGRGGYIVLKEG